MLPLVWGEVTRAAAKAPRDTSHTPANTTTPVTQRCLPCLHGLGVYITSSGPCRGDILRPFYGVLIIESQDSKVVSGDLTSGWLVSNA